MALLIFFLVAPIVLGLALMILMDKKSKATLSKKLWIVFVLLLVSFLPFTYDIIMTNIFSAYYCNTAPNPKTHIGKKVEYPVSIYWEDNVYPGFSKEDRALMIINYLDGEHLKTMALNAPDGKIYVYHLDKPIWKTFKQEFAEKFGRNPRKIPPNKKNHFSGSVYTVYNAYAKEIMKTEKIYTKATMPALNYTVTFDEVPLPKLARKFLYSDETKITENSTGEVIAYNRRYMRFFYKLHPDIALGNRYYWQVPMCGDYRYGFERNIFQYRANNGFKSSDQHEIDLNIYLYNKYIKEGE